MLGKKHSNFSNKTSNKSAQPINIPIKKPSNSSEYSFKLNTFDPNNCSPPNSWNTRLAQKTRCL